MKTLSEIIAARLSRRGFLEGLGTSGLVVLAGCSSDDPAPTTPELAVEPPASRPFGFDALAPGLDGELHVPQGFEAQVLISWGDSLTEGAPLDLRSPTPEDQRRCFGYNNDYIGLVPISDDHVLLCVNHEYTTGPLMFVGLETMGSRDPQQIRVEMAAHGHSIVEVERGADNAWSVSRKGRCNRRITAETQMVIRGPAAGSERMKTAADSSGTRVFGTVSNCAGGVTPWGTVLIAEENFQDYFLGPVAGREADNGKRYGIAGPAYKWHRLDERFDATKHPNEPNRFGWIVEIDPSDPASEPIKRTAMGRFSHEGAATHLMPDGRVVAYMGDDARFEYLYRYVSSGTFDETRGKENGVLLDEGVLSVARFEEDGTVAWLPLVHGEGPLTVENGFASQADVVIEARRAGDLLGATRLDRPEDVETNPVTGRVYVMLTNNSHRDEADAVNPRAPNAHGHILEIIPADGDHGAVEAKWELLLLAGPISEGGRYASVTRETQAFSCPDNCAFDSKGNLYVSTDGSPSTMGISDGIYLVETEGKNRGNPHRLVRAPRGAEVCGPFFTADDRDLFFAVQHPADDPGSTFEKPSTRWPDFTDGAPPRPSVVVLRRSSGGPITA